MKISFLPVVAAICLLTSALSAQKLGTRVEIAPFAGFETGASFPVQSPIDPITGLPTSSIDSLGVEKGLTYGGFFDYFKSENFAFEFMYARNPTAYDQHDFLTGQSTKAFNTNFDQYQFGALFNIFGSVSKLQPYFAGGLGFTHQSASQFSNSTAFAFNLGGGARYFSSRHFGWRGDIRFIPTYANSIQGTICDPFFGCYGAKQRNFLKRVNFTGGIILRF